MTFRCIPLAAKTARRWRRTGVDDAGHVVLRRTADADAGYPCRVAPASGARAGEAMPLGSDAVPEPRGVYASNSPVFGHARDCAPEIAPVAVAATVRISPLSLLSDDATGMLLYVLGVGVDGMAVDTPLAVALGDRPAGSGDIHTARPACWLTRIEPTSRTR